MPETLKLGEWHRPGVEIPPGWHARLAKLALDINRGKTGMQRYVLAVALDLVFSLKEDQVYRRARELQNLDLDDFPALVKRHALDPDAFRFPDEPAKRMLEAAEKKVAHKRRKRGA